MDTVHVLAKHDDRKGHHYYTRKTGRRCSIVVMTLAVIMLGLFALGHISYNGTAATPATYQARKQAYFPLHNQKSIARFRKRKEQL